MDIAHKATIGQAIALLQSLIGSSVAAQQPQKAIIPIVDSLIATTTQMAQQLGPEVQKLTAIFVEAVNAMELIIGYSSFCKKFTSQEEDQLKKKFMELAVETEAIQRKSAEYVDHSRAIRELLSVTFWVFVTTPEIIIKGSIQSADFHAIRFQKKKIVPQIEWYSKIGQAVRQLQKYVKENYPSGLTFNFNGTHSWSALISGVKEEPIKTEVKSQVKPEVKGKEPSKSKKELIGQNFNIMNFVKEKIKLEQGEIQMKHGVFVEKCRETTVEITGKCKSVQLNQCEKITLMVRSCVSGLEIMNSKEVTIYVKDSVPSIAVDNSQNVRVILNCKNLACEIVSSKVTELNVSYEKEDGNEVKDYSVSEQFITKWNAGKSKFETQVFKHD